MSLDSRKQQPFALALALALAVAACAQLAPAGQKQQSAGGPMVIEEERNGQSIPVRVGDEVVIQLSAQMGTGYSWQLRSNDAKVAVPLGEPELQSKPGQAPGAAELQLFHFRIQASGSTIIKLEYARPWEKNQQAQKTFSVTLQAQ